MTYFDASAFTSLFLGDTHTARVHAFFQTQPSIAISNLTAIEFSSAIARAIRTRRTTEAAAREVLARVDAWVVAEPVRAEILPADIALADAYVRDFALALRAPDAIHIAICRRLGLGLATCDDTQAAAARALGIDAVNLSAGAVA